MPFPPRPPPDLSPPYVTFVFEQNHPLSPLNRFPPRGQFFVIAARRSRTCASLRLGLPFSVQCYLSPRAASHAEYDCWD